MKSTVQLGEDIVEYSGSDEPTIAELERSRYRFLNHLWLPVPLSELTPAQVLITNRFRESKIGQDSQFNKASRARKAARLAMSAGEAGAVLEVGMGSFPIFMEGDHFEYHGLDIDPVAISNCRRRGLKASVASRNSLTDLSQKFDFFLALYVFHFAYDEDFISALKDSLTSDSVGAFTVIVADNQHFLRLLSLFGPELPWMRVLKLPLMASKEFWVVVGGASAAHRASSVEAAIIAAYDS